MSSSGLSDPAPAPGASLGRGLAAWLLVALGLLGLGLADRRDREATAGMSQGPGLLVGIEAGSDLEHRGAPLSVPLVRDRGAPLRAGGVSLCTLGLLLAAGRRRGAAGGARRWARWLWASPGAVGIYRLVQAGDPGGGAAGGSLGLSALLMLLSLSLLAAWRE